MKKRKGPKPLPVAEKQKRGTLRPCRARTKTAHRRRAPPLATVASETRNFVTVADAYVADVLSGAIVACRWTKLACERFRRMRKGGPSTFTWSPAHVQDVCTFIERLPYANSITLRCDRRLCEADQREELDAGRLESVASSAWMNATRRTSSCTTC